MDASPTDSAHDITVSHFDPCAATEAEWARLNAYRKLRADEDFPGEPTLPDAEFVREVKTPHPLRESRRTLALRDGECVGNMILFYRRAGTEHFDEHAPFVDVWGGVSQRHRREGIGRLLMAELLAFMRQQSKTTASWKVHLPESHAFMAACGAEARLRSVQSRMPLGGLDWTELAHWQARVAEATPSLEWEIHSGRLPFSRLAALDAPLSDLVNQQPLGSVSMPRMRYSLAGYERWYADMDTRGGEHFMVLLRQGDEVVAVCDANWDARFPERAYQELTAVAPSWRGKGLAKAVKAAMLQLIHKRQPQVQSVITLNAETNAAMRAINQRLGFVVHREEATYQLGHDALAIWLAGHMPQTAG